MLTRRETIAGGLAAGLGCGSFCCSAATPQAPHSAGCHLTDVDFDALYPRSSEDRGAIRGDEPIILNSGDREFDFALAQTLAKLSSKFGVVPGFAYYDDSDSENAYATSRVRLNNVDGTVLMGIKLFQRLRRGHDSPEVAVAGVCAHEFGHIIQYKYGLIGKVNAGQKTIKRSELQADYFAGYFAGIRKFELPSFPAAEVTLTLHNFGDVAFNDPTHHGTPQERAASAVRGFQAAFKESKNLSEAIDESTAYVLTL